MGQAVSRMRTLPGLKVLDMFGKCQRPIFPLSKSVNHKGLGERHLPEHYISHQNVSFLYIITRYRLFVQPSPWFDPSPPRVLPFYERHRTPFIILSKTRINVKICTRLDDWSSYLHVLSEKLPLSKKNYVSHNVLYYQQLVLARYQLRFYVNSYCE